MEEQKVASTEENRSTLEEQVRALFGQITTNHYKLDSTQLSAAISSLKVSLVGVLLDLFRAQAKPEGLQQEDSMASCQLWERIQQLLPDVREQRLAFLLFHCNLSPSEILLYAPQEFRDRQEICYLRRKIFDRIQQDLDHKQ
jgi:hypothetical protein